MLEFELLELDEVLAPEELLELDDELLLEELLDELVLSLPPPLPPQAERKPLAASKAKIRKQ